MWDLKPYRWIFYNVTLKSMGLSCTLNTFFTHAWFNNIMHCSLLTNVVLKTSKKLHSLVLGICQAPGESFPKFYFLWNASILSLATNTASCSPWNAKLTLLIKKKNLPEYPSLNNYNLSAHHSFKKKMVFHEQSS